MAGVTGIGSGIDIDSIVKSMVAAERAPKETQLANLEKKTTTQISAVGALNGALADFQASLKALNKPELFQARSATSSSSDLVGVSATTKAGGGTYQVEVKELASNSKIALAAVKNTTEAPARFASGTLSISLGGPSVPPAEATKESFSIQVDESNNTLAGMRDAINKEGKDIGISATIVTDEFGSRLVLSSSKSGEGRDITVAGDGDAQQGKVGLSDLTFDGTPGDEKSGRTLVPAQSAVLSVDGLRIVSATNKVEGAIEGVTLDLKGKTAANEPLSIGVEEDKAGVKAQVQTFVDAYNKLIGVINAQTKVTSAGGDNAPVAGALVGDSAVRTLLGAIRNELVNSQGEGAIRALADIGITTQKNGTLVVDSDKLDKRLADNFEQVSGLFTGTAGLASRLDAKIKPYTETGGIFEQRDKQLNDTKSGIGKQREDLDRRIISLQARLFKQFNAMDLLVGQLGNTSSSLIASLENLPWAAGNRK